MWPKPVHRVLIPRPGRALRGEEEPDLPADASSRRGIPRAVPCGVPALPFHGTGDGIRRGEGDSMRRGWEECFGKGEDVGGGMERICL